MSRLLSHRLRYISLAFALLAALIAPQTGSALDDPELDYYTLETDHFYVHYYTGLENFARRVAGVHEEAHQILSPILEWTPADKTHVVITDKSDTANGAARAFGRNRVLIYTMPPAPEGVLGYYDDWLRILVYHEYVHVLHLDTASEEAPIINMFIGKQVLPNQIIPRWYTEGLATMHESRRTGTGRVNSSLFQMWLRTAALEDRFFALGTASGSPVEWPMGSAVYLYGSFFLDYVTKTRGADFGRDFNHLYGSRLIPFSLNQAAEQVSGSTFHDMWKEWTAHVIGESLAKQVVVSASGRTTLEQITDAGGSNRSARQRPGRGHMSFYRSNLKSDSAFSVALPDGGHRELFTVDGATGAHDWTPDGDTLVYGRRAIIDNVYSYNDLFARHLPSGQNRRITRGERAREPAVSPDGERVAYVRNLHGTMELVVRALGRNATGDARVVVGAEQWPDDAEGHWQQVSMPAWRPDGRALVFSWWRLDTRQRDLWLYEFDKPDGERLTQLTDDAAQELTPFFDADGRLYFACDRTGIFNIFLMEIDEQRTWQLSNVVNGVFDPRPSADGRWIYVSTYTKDGYELARFRRPTRLWHPAPEAAYTPARRQYPEVDESSWSNGPYRPLRWLGPLTLQPEGMLMFEGGGLGGVLTGYGPLDRHRWQLSGVWATGETSLDRSTALAGSYSYGGLPFNVSAQASARTFPRSRGFIAESRYVPFSERSYSAGLSANYPIRTVSDQLRLSTTMLLRRNEFAQQPAVDHEPADVQPATPDHGWSSNVRFGLLYTNLERYPQSISLADGLFARLSVSLQHDLGDPDLNSIALTYGGGGYLSVPWFDHHVLAVQLNGGIIRSTFGGSRGFAIGGHSPQDVLTDLILQEPRGQFVLRGFPPGFSQGTQYQVWTGSYRFPLANLDQGFSTVPVFFRRAKGAVFVDAGGAFDGYLVDADYLASVGAEVQVDALFGYMMSGALRLGFARGLTAGGVSEWYVRYGGGF